jgi:hypothetical protein
MVLPLIQMEKTSRSTGKNSKASQGGLTSPKLYQLGPDFQNCGRKTRKRRQVRISCIFVAHYFCARVKSQIVSSLAYHCTPLHTIVCHCTRLSHTIVHHRIPSYTIAYHRTPSHTIVHHRIPLYTIAYHRTPSHTIVYRTPPMENDRDPPPVENDPSSGK